MLLNEGMRIILVGGAVRDILLGRPVRDRDYLVTGATVEEFLAAHPAAKPVGKTFPVFILDGQEYSFPRAETLDADLALRDFTVNALAMDAGGALYAHPQALDDLRRRVLRPCSPHALSDDPLRAYRAARFCAELPGFAPHQELLQAMRGLSGTPALATPYAERVGREVMKACEAARPGDFLRVLDSGGCLAPWLEELAGAGAIPAGPPKFHDASVLEHTARLMDALAGDSLCVWMALCHDLGKTTTPSDVLPRHIGHEERGESLALALGNRLRLPHRNIQAGADAARWHMLAGRYAELRPATRVDLLFRLKSRAVLRELFRLAAVDTGVDHLPEAQADLDAALGVKLSTADRDRGAASGELLRSLRAQAIRHRRR
jgi:tRNA nucleotidyltransferase (CCA-adding enzyme)